MSLPSISNISPNITITREQVINLLLASIGLEGLGLAHIINAEGEKIQLALGSLNSVSIPLVTSIEDLIIINQSVDNTIKNVIKKEILMQFKFEDIIKTLPRCITEIRAPDGTLWFTVEFVNVINNTWKYIITNVNAPHALSHWSLRIECINNVEIINWSPEDAIIDTTENETCPSTDPSCGPSGQNFGIKFNYPVEVGQSVTYTFTLNKEIELGYTCFLLKFGQQVRCGIICGPQC